MTKDRRSRQAALLAGAMAIMPVVAAAMPSVSAATSRPAQFQPPREPMVLTRTLHRALPGGAEVKTRRSYEVRFVSDGDGYRIDGELLETLVDAPPALQALAALEKRRPDDSMFPMRLDARGLLKPAESPVTSSATSQQAVDLALRHIDRLNLPAGQAKEARTFVNQIRNRTGHTPWPDDLFNPAPGQRRQVQTIPLPNGGQGQVSIEIEAHADAPTGLLASFARTVTTELGGDSRITREIWTLSDKIRDRSL